MVFEDNQQFLSTLSLHYSSIKLIALDVGQRKIGCATCYLNLKVVTPHKLILRKNIKTDINNIKLEIINNNIHGIVLGLPLNLDNQPTTHTQTMVLFAQKLAKTLKIPITFYDEKLTTKLAHRKLSELNKSRKQQHAIDDIISAAIILEDFLKFNHL